MEGFVLAPGSGGYSHHGGEGMRQEHEAFDHIYSSDRKQQCDECFYSTSFPLLIQLRTPAYQVEPLTVRMGLPTLISSS